MAEQLSSYEQRKTEILSRSKASDDLCDMETYAEDRLEGTRQVGIADVLNVGSKVVIGGGVGLLAGIATIAVVASAGELILAGVVTKIAGVLGGALGLTMGIDGLRKGKKPN